MEEDLLKRNTDCVYFLASPLTCKKRMDCEYRHNEIARLNPRDCWYWLSGNCLNPTCGFRHPPLEKHTEETLELASSSYQSSVSANKTSVPCYFYYSGFCSKGDTCSFSHGRNGNAPSTTCAKAPSIVTNVAPGTDMVLKSTEAHTSPSETAPKVVVDLKLRPKEDLAPLSVPKNLKCQSENSQVYVSPCDEGGALESDAILSAKGNALSTSPVCSDQSPQEQVDDHVEPEQRWESSPGFDVLVEDISDTLVSEDEEEYLQSLDRENRELTNHLGYHFEDSLEYDSRYSDELLHETDMYDSFDSVDGLPICDDESLNSGYSRNRMLDSLMSRKRKFLPVDLTINDLRGIDLRERLRKRRLVGGNQFISRSSRRHASPYLRSQSQERLPRRSISKQLHGRLASEVGKNAIGSLESYRSGSSFCPNRLGRHSIYDSNRTKLRYKGRRLAERKFLSSEVAREPLSKHRMFSQASTEFTGPKTYAQIKEEKSKAEKTADKNLRGTGSVDFEGPKPLSEILKDKKRLGSVTDTNIGGGN